MKIKDNKIITNIKETIIVVIGIIILVIIVGHLAAWMEQADAKLIQQRDLDYIITLGTDLILNKIKGPEAINISDSIVIIDNLSKEHQLNANEKLRVLISIKNNLFEIHEYKSIISIKNNLIEYHNIQVLNTFEKAKLKFVIFEFKTKIDALRVAHYAYDSAEKILNSISKKK